MITFLHHLGMVLLLCLGHLHSGKELLLYLFEVFHLFHVLSFSSEAHSTTYFLRLVIHIFSERFDITGFIESSFCVFGMTSGLFFVLVDGVLIMHWIKLIDFINSSFVFLCWFFIVFILF